MEKYNKKQRTGTRKKDASFLFSFFPEEISLSGSFVPVVRGESANVQLF